MMGLVVLSAMVVSIGTAAAAINFYAFKGEITDGSVGVEGVNVVIVNTDTGMKWCAKTDSDGYYAMYYKYSSDIEGYYELRVDGNTVASQDLTKADFEKVGQILCFKVWSYEWNANIIPEFSTIALPAASILGLLFFFNHRKRRKK